MIPRVRYRALLFLASLTMLAVPGRPHTDADHIKGEYISITAQLQKHLVFDWWIDSDPKPPELLARQWSLAGQYVAAWLDTHPSQGTAGVKEALTQLEPGESAPQQKKFFRSFFCCGTCGE